MLITNVDGNKNTEDDSEDCDSEAVKNDVVDDKDGDVTNANVGMECDSINGTKKIQ